MKKVIILSIAIIAIACMEIVALQNGIDGTLLSASFAAIGGLAGYAIKSKTSK